MNLLPPQEAKQAVAQNEEQAKKKLREILDYLDEGVRKLNHFKEHDARERMRITDEFKAFEAETATKKQTLTREVESLEARKREAEKPLDERSRQLDEREVNLHDREVDLNAYANELDKLSDDLDAQDSLHRNSLADLESREADLAQRERKLAKEKQEFDKWMNHREKILTEKRDELRAEFEKVESKK